MPNRFSECVRKLVEILFVQMYFGFYKTAVIEFTALAFSNGDVIIAVSGSFYIEEICSFSCLYLLGENLLLRVVVVFNHRKYFRI